MGIFGRDRLSQLKKASEPLYKTPRSVQEAIEILKIAQNGIFEVKENRFSKTYLFADLNYTTTDEEEQISIFERYCKFLNSFDVEFKITINNKNRNMKNFRREILFPMQNDGYDSYRKIYNRIIEERIMEGKQGIEQQRYLTVTITRKNFEEAKAYFATLEVTMSQSFASLGSMLIPLNCEERLRILHDFYRLGKEEEFSFDYKECRKRGADFKNDICNQELKFLPNYFEDPDKVCRAFFIKKYPSALSDRFLNEITNLPIHSLTSIDVTPISKDVTTQILQKKYLGIESDIIRQQQKRNRNNDFSSDISYKKRNEKKEIEGIMDDVRENDQCLFLAGVTIVLIAKDKEELDSVTETLVTIGKRNGCQIEPHYLQQREALNSALPVGVRQVETMRTLLTQSLAVLMPFNVQELIEKDGFYYGINQVSKNIIMGNRKRLVNGNGFIFGVPGSGKSFFCKQVIGNILLNTKDDVIIIDPQNEYFELADTFGGSVVNYSVYTQTFANPYVIPEGLEDVNGFISDKGEFTLGLVEQCMGQALNSRQKSIIDRCVRLMYKELLQNLNMKEQTLLDLYAILMEQPEEEAKNIALSLELFVYGSLNIFTHPSNVEEDNRFRIYGIGDLGRELSAISMLVMLESISTKISENAKKGRATWLFVDEFHVLLGNGNSASQNTSEYASKFLFSLWKKVRKQGGMCTGITQNISDLLQNYIATTMLSNSEFVVLLRQSVTDSKKLAEVLSISEAQLKYVVNSPAGTGLLKHGNTVVPFDNRIDKDTKLYQLFNTNIHEIIHQDNVA